MLLITKIQIFHIVPVLFREGHGRLRQLMALNLHLREAWGHHALVQRGCEILSLLCSINLLTFENGQVIFGPEVSHSILDALAIIAVKSFKTLMVNSLCVNLNLWWNASWCNHRRTPHGCELVGSNVFGAWSVRHQFWPHQLWGSRSRFLVDLCCLHSLRRHDVYQFRWDTRLWLGFANWHWVLSLFKLLLSDLSFAILLQGVQSLIYVFQIFDKFRWSLHSSNI